MSKRKSALLLIALAAGLVSYQYDRPLLASVYHVSSGKRTVADAVAQYGPAAEQRLSPAFQAAGAPYPPSRITFIALKKEKRLELWSEVNGQWVLIKNYPVKAASGGPGPKLREGDLQVPEGFYRLEGLNPNSSYHLSLKLNYPNPFDKKQARLDGRSQLGGDIFIHGKSASIGCLAMGDEAIEELFVLASRTGIANISVIIAPHDLRLRAAITSARQPEWVTQLYASIKQELNRYGSATLER